MSYLNKNTGEYPLTELDIRMKYPDTYLAELPEEFVWVFPSPATYDNKTSYVKEIVPQQTDKGHWEQQWEVVPFSEEELKVLQLKEKEDFNASIRSQIVAIENKQGRAVREAILSGDNTYLVSLNEQIVVLRSQLWTS